MLPADDTRAVGMHLLHSTNACKTTATQYQAEQKLKLPNTVVHPSLFKHPPRNEHSRRAEGQFLHYLFEPYSHMICNLTTIICPPQRLAL